MIPFFSENEIHFFYVFTRENSYSPMVYQSRVNDFCSISNSHQPRLEDRAMDRFASSTTSKTFLAKSRNNLIFTSIIRVGLLSLLGRANRFFFPCNWNKWWCSYKRPFSSCEHLVYYDVVQSRDIISLHG